MATSTQGPAVGSAIHAAVAAGAYRTSQRLAAVMGDRPDNVVIPIPENAAVYDVLFAEYTKLHEYFGRGTNPVMRRLKEVRRAAALRRRVVD